jgi:hypothetical protein
MPVSELGSLLRYGVPGLVLGIMIAALIGVARMSFTDDRLQALKSVLRYGVTFAIIATIAVLVPLFVDPQLTVKVTVSPNAGKQETKEVPAITNGRGAPADSEGNVLVGRDDPEISVDVSKLKKLLDVLEGKLSAAQIQIRDTNTQLAALKRGNELTVSDYAAIAQTTPEAHAAVTSVVTAGSIEAATAAAVTACESGKPETCGWAHLAAGNVVAAQKSFQAAAENSMLPQATRASAYNGLGYTYLMQGQTKIAIDKIEHASEHGSAQSKLQLDAIKSQSTEYDGMKGTQPPPGG